MELLLLPVGATVCCVGALLGWRLLRSTGLETVADGLSTVGPEGPERVPMLIRVVDGAGRRFQRLLLSAYGPRRRARLDARLEASGRPEGLTERDFLRRKAGFGSLGVLFGTVFLAAGQTLVAVLVVAVCFVWMDVWLRAVVSRRRREIALNLPDFLDVVAVTVTAGLNLQQALDRVASHDTGVLGNEIRKTLNDMRYGLSRRQALEALRDRNDVGSMATFVTAMLQAEELGTPLAEALQDIAAEVRREAAQDARRAAAKAGPKVSLVVTMTIVPGAMILIVSAMVLANLPRFRGLFG